VSGEIYSIVTMSQYVAKTLSILLMTESY